MESTLSILLYIAILLKRIFGVNIKMNAQSTFQFALISKHGFGMMKSML